MRWPGYLLIGVGIFISLTNFMCTGFMAPVYYSAYDVITRSPERAILNYVAPLIISMIGVLLVLRGMREK